MPGKVVQKSGSCRSEEISLCGSQNLWHVSLWTLHAWNCGIEALGYPRVVYGIIAGLWCEINGTSGVSGVPIQIFGDMVYFDSNVGSWTVVPTVT